MPKFIRDKHDDGVVQDCRDRSREVLPNDDPESLDGLPGSIDAPSVARPARL
jgi:hypothetical protein